MKNKHTLKPKKPLSPIAFIFGFMRPYSWGLTILVILFLFNSLLATAQPIVLSPVINIVLDAQNGSVPAQEGVTLANLNLIMPLNLLANY